MSRVQIFARKLILCCSGLVPLTAAIASAQTVTVRSGNGSVGGRDAAVTFLLGPPTGDFNHLFTATDFSNAQAGPAAFIVTPNPAWIPKLPSDPSAQWIGTNSDAGSSGNTALYAVAFTIANPFSSATLTLNFAVDDGIGATNPGILLNGTAICDAYGQGFGSQSTVSCNDVGPLLHVGTNWFYIEGVNQVGAAGLLFSAAITTTESSAPSINAGGVVNAGSGASTVAPGSLAAAFGSFPVSGTSTVSVPSWPTSLGGVSIQFAGGVQAPLYYVSPGQVNLQVPWELAGQSQSSVTAIANAQTSSAQTAKLGPFSPAIFSTNGQGTGQGAILNSTYQLVDSSNPASPGITDIQIYSTGLGAVTNQPATGAPAPTNSLAMTLTAPTLTIGGVPSFVQFSGLAPGWVGLYQVNALVPAAAPSGDSVPVVLSIGGISSNTVTIAVQSPATPNPSPSITGLSPSSAAAGSSALTLTINGSGFIPTSSVTFNGVAHTQSFGSSGQLTIVLTASDLATAGSFATVVTNPPPGGGSSSPVNFNVSPASVPVPPAPTGLSPGSTVPPGVTVNTLTPTLSWNASPGATGYSVAIINNSTEASFVANIATTSIISPTLTSGATYVWSVAAYNASGQSALATPVYFTVAPIQTGVTGTWQGAWGSVPSPNSYGPLSATLTQTGSAVTGTVTLTFSPCFTTGTLSGTISGNTISLTGTFPPQQQVLFSGTTSSTATEAQINGAYAVSSGLCAGDYGIFTVTKL